MDLDELKELEINSLSNRDIIISKFCELWKTPEELQNVIINRNISSEHLLQLVNHFSYLEQHAIKNQQRLANILYEIVGQKFLRKKEFVALIFDAIKKYDVSSQFEHLIVNEASNIFGKHVKKLDSVIELDRTGNWMIKLAQLTGFPESCGLKEKVENLPHSEIIIPHINLNPLYDYQYSIGRRIRELLDGRDSTSKGIVSLPTGAGKTRLVTESIIDWINENEDFRKNSKFIIWITQSEELCEQAFSSFKDVFEDKGRIDTSLQLHRFFGNHKTLPELHENGVIISSIGMLHSSSKNTPVTIAELAMKTAVIIIDEAHHSIADSYQDVLTLMGFNFDRRKKNTPENKYGIILLGLTATPFRRREIVNSTENTNEYVRETETEKLHRMYSHNFLLPPMSTSEILSENEKPHVLIDCQNTTPKNEWIRISGNRSYDRDGKIVKYRWMILDNQDNQVFTEEGVANDALHYKFDNEGIFKIILEVEDNEGEKNLNHKMITIGPERKEIKYLQGEQMKAIFKHLVQREILCDVYHKTIKLNTSVSNLILSDKDLDYLKQYQDFNKTTIKKLEYDHSRNVKIVDEILKLIQNGKKSILFFACSVEHAKIISTTLNACGIRSRYIDATTDREERHDSIRKFKTQEIHVLCNFGILTTGFDAPKTDCVFIARPTMSYLLYTQMAGRGLRGIKNSGTRDCLIIDVDDNIILHNLTTAVEKPELVWIQFKDIWKEISSEIYRPETESPIIHEQENEDYLFHVCPRCNKKATGFEQMAELFGMSDHRRTKNNPRGVQSYCRKCRTIERKISHDVELPNILESLELDKEKTFLELLNFVTSEMRMQSNYQPIMLIHLIKNGHSTKVEIAESLAHANNSDSIEHYLSVPVYDVLENHGFVIKNFENQYLINVDLSEDGKKRILYELEKQLETVSPKTDAFEYYENAAVSHYQKLKQTLGHTPTQRLYAESSPPANVTIIEAKFGSFQTFQKQQGDNPRTDQQLKEELIDAYFELYHELGKSISVDDVNEKGKYKQSDYDECFGSFVNFETLIKSFLLNLHSIKSVDNETLEIDYRTVRRTLGHEPTFDELRYNSNLGIEYYIRNFGSLTKFKQTVGIENKIGRAMIDLRTDYYKIKDALGTIPTYTQMCKYSKNFLTITTQFENYVKFLEAINESINELKNIPDDIGTRKQKELLDKYDEHLKKMGKLETLKILYEDKEITFKEWFGGKHKFIKALGLDDPSMISAYAKIEAQKLMTPAKTESSSIMSSAKSKIDQIVSNKNIPSKTYGIRNFFNQKISFYNLKKCPQCHKEQLRDVDMNRKYCSNCRCNFWAGEQY